MRVLIAEDQPEVQALMKRFIEARGHEVCCANDGVAALEKIAKCPPEIIFSDVRMPRMDGLALLGKIREKSLDTIFIIVTGEGSENCAVEALRLGANNYIKKPFDPRKLGDLLSKYEGIITERMTGRELQNFVVRRTLRMRLENRCDISSAVARMLVAEAGERLRPEDRLDITLGLDELLINAIEHGNMAITSDEKKKALQQPSGMEQLYRKRMEDPQLAARHVTVDYTDDENGFLEWIIQDEGQGFDWHNLPDPTEESAIFEQCGRGIFLTRMFFDELEFNEKGNQVRVRKYAPRA